MVCRWCNTKALHLVKQGGALQAKSGGRSSRTSELPIGALAGNEDLSMHLIECRYAPFAASAITADGFPVVLKLQILSSSSSALGSPFYPLDPLSDIGRTILEFDAIGLAAGEKFHRVLVDECQVPQIQY
jgi:hypothetical protein